ncbi:DUF805 domain-containing protein [Kineococcus sp. NUM-3379]
MNAAEAVRSSLHRYAGFSGRARRSEYWYFALFTLAVSAVAGLVDRAIGSDLETGSGLGIVGLITSLALLVPGLAVFWRRMHDTGRSGAWVLLWFVPIFGWVAAVVLCCLDSEPAHNRFGPSPTPPVHV